MPIVEFKLPQIPAGVSLHHASDGETVQIRTAEIALASDPALVQSRLDALHQSIFSHIPGLPEPYGIKGLQVIIRPDLTATAYINELSVILKTRVARSVKAGEPVRPNDVSDIEGVELGVEVPENSCFLNVATLFWKRSLYWDFNPLCNPPRPRLQPLSDALAEQYRSLWGLPSGLPPVEDPFSSMSAALKELKRLASSDAVREGQVQELLAAHPWMLGGQYRAVNRHSALDDANIPDFCATRTTDGCLDIVELKLPSAKCSRADGTLSAEFHDAWSQTERYLAFADRNASYLLRDKSLRFENPKAVLLMGRNLDDDVRKRVREKESFSGRIMVVTYDQLITQANAILGFARGASVGAPHFGP